MAFGNAILFFPCAFFKNKKKSLIVIMLDQHHRCKALRVSCADLSQRLAYLNTSRPPRLRWLQVCPAPTSQRWLLAVASCWASLHQGQAPVKTKGAHGKGTPEITDSITSALGQ